MAIASLARLRGSLGAPERRALAILCLLESDRAGADGLVADDALGARYWNYVGTAAAHPPKPAPREFEARRRFYEWERELDKADSMAWAILKYKSLATE